MRNLTFLIAASAVGAAVFLTARLIGNEYLFFAGYIVLQFIVLATAWNILGGYCGYVNFGSAAFFAVGAYTTVALHKLGADPERYLRYLSDVTSDVESSWLSRGGAWLLGEIVTLLQPLLPFWLPTLIVLGGVVSGLVGFGMGYLTLRLRGVFFAIATLAMAVVLQTFVINWDYVGGSRGAYVLRPDSIDLGPVTLTYIQYLFLLMLLLAVLALWIARTIERSRMGLGFATIRDDEAAAEASGVPTLRLKLAATALSGALMGMAGAPLPYYIGFVEPAASFGLPYAVNSIAMPMIGGTTNWAGPLVGAILLGTLQQIATVTISSVVNLLLVGVLLVAFVIAAPVGIVGLMQELLRTAAPTRLNFRSIAIIVIASYCFLVGIVAIIFNLPSLQTANATVAFLGACGILVGTLYLTASYGLLKLRGWARPVAALAFVSSIAFGAAHIWLDPAARSLGIHTVMIAIALLALWYLQHHDVRVLYKRLAGSKLVAT